MSMDIHKFRSTPINPSSTSFPRLDIFKQCQSSANDGCLNQSTLGHALNDQDSTRLALQSCLEWLDQHYVRLDSACKENVEIRTLITDILASCQLAKITMRNVGAWDSGLDFQAMFDEESQTIAPVALNELNAIPLLSPSPGPSLLPEPLAFQHVLGQFSGKEYGSQYAGATSIQSEGVDLPVRQLSQDLLLFDTVSYELGTQIFQGNVPQHGTCSEGQTLSGPSARHHQQPCLPIVLDGEEKVKCEWSGCSSSVKRGNYTRHVNEIHRRKVKAVCAGCGKTFPRPYMKKTHICRVRHSTC